MAVESKFIGLALALASSVAIGTSFVLTKKGLTRAGKRQVSGAGDFRYLRSPLWWAGIATLAIGELFNCAAYAFAPAILVTPLGALSVLVGAVLGSYFLQEELGMLGKLGCAICLMGALVVFLHAPPEKEIETVDQILEFAVQPGFLFYAFTVAAFALIMIFIIAPIYGEKNALVYLSICSTVGSVSVMAVKALGIALKLTFAGNNQFTHLSTYFFMALTAVCVLTQVNYFNKALSQFPANLVNPLYYVTFTTATLCASFTLFGGFNTADADGIGLLVCGFLVTFTGVYLLNISKASHGHHMRIMERESEEVPYSDAASRFPTYLSARASSDARA